MLGGGSAMPQGEVLTRRDHCDSICSPLILPSYISFLVIYLFYKSLNFLAHLFPLSCFLLLLKWALAPSNYNHRSAVFPSLSFLCHMTGRCLVLQYITLCLCKCILLASSALLLCFLAEDINVTQAVDSVIAAQQ